MILDHFDMQVLARKENGRAKILSTQMAGGEMNATAKKILEIIRASHLATGVDISRYNVSADFNAKNFYNTNTKLSKLHEITLGE